MIKLVKQVSQETDCLIADYQKEAMPLVHQLKASAKVHQAYCINPDGSIQFNLEPWDGK